MSRKEVRAFNSMSSFVDQFQCVFHCFYGKKRAFQLSANILTISLDSATIFEEFSKTDGKGCAHDFDHAGAAFH